MITISDWAVIVAIIFAPLVAIQVQKYLERRDEEKGRKKQIFAILMATRATRLSPDHVEALNRIDIEFYKDKKVKEVWKALLDTFGNFPQDTKAEDYQIKLNSCSQESDNLLADLLYEMAKVLSYDFDKTHLKRGAYIPKGHTDDELEQRIMRRALVEVLLARKPLKVSLEEKSITLETTGA